MRMIRYTILALLGAALVVMGPAQPQSTAAQAGVVQQYPALEQATSSDMSFNWAGYVASGEGPYTAVSGSWVVPEASAPAETGVAANATWVGIGGVHGSDLIQAGTQAVVSQGGEVYYQAWLERLPAASEPLPIRIAAGDRVSVSLSQHSPGLWRVSVANLTTGAYYTVAVPYDSSLSSAEWIEEMPSTVRGSFIPLSDFGVTRFVSGSAVADGQTASPASAGARPLVMVSRHGEVLATVSVLDGQGGFAVERTDAASHSARQAMRPRARLLLPE